MKSIINTKKNYLRLKYVYIGDGLNENLSIYFV